jgi:tetratricopeptide (TPR) repeat protein
MRIAFKRRLRLTAALFFIVLPPLFSLETGQQGGKINWMDKEWRAYDVNADGKFDKQDIEQLLADGWQTFSSDLNYDGKKDVSDVFALFVKLSVLDRNCDEAVDDDDFISLLPVEFPEPDVEKVWLMVNEIVPTARVKAPLPVDIEQRLFEATDNSNFKSVADRAYVYQAAGVSALIQKNLDAAQWAFGRAFQTWDRSSSALGSLAFAVAVDKRRENAHSEAMTLLSYALGLYPESGATLSTIGWIFARHGQDKEALKYYLKAVEHAPNVGMYHMNLGITYLRLGQTELAHKEFLEATEEDPGDIRANIFRYTVPPKVPPPHRPPVDMEKLKKDYEEWLKRIQGGDEDNYEEWIALTPCEISHAIPEILDDEYTQKHIMMMQPLSNDLAMSWNESVKSITPEFRDASEDMKRFLDGAPIIIKRDASARSNATTVSGNIWASFCHERGNTLLDYYQFFHDNAKKETEARFNELFRQYENLPMPEQNKRQLKEKIYQDVREDVMRHCFEEIIREAIGLMMIQPRPEGLPDPEIETVSISALAGIPVAIVSGCLEIKGYCKEGVDYGGGISSLGFDPTIGFDFLCIDFTYNLNTREIEVNIGLGFYVGATWSPDAGFAFQVGEGVEVDAGPLDAKTIVFIKYYPETGKVVVQTKTGASIDLGIKLGIERVSIQAVAGEA